MAEISRPEPPSTKPGLSLSPLVPPNIEPGPLNKAVLENASVTLECLASGVPPPGKTPLLGRPRTGSPELLSVQGSSLDQQWGKGQELGARSMCSADGVGPGRV